MEDNLFILYDTNQYGSHASRSDIGLFDSIELALTTLVKESIERVSYIFEGGNRLFIDSVEPNKIDGFNNCFDSDNSDNLMLLKKIIFFEAKENFMNDLGFLDGDEQDVIDMLASIDSIEDVTDLMIHKYMEDESGAGIKANRGELELNFIKRHFEF